MYIICDRCDSVIQVKSEQLLRLGLLRKDRITQRIRTTVDFVSHYFL